MTRLALRNLVLTFLDEYPSEDCVAITQDGDGSVYYWKSKPTFDGDSDGWEAGSGKTPSQLCDGIYYPRDGSGDALELETSTDYDTAIITRDMFEEAIKLPKGDLREWRDRIIEIRELQNALKDELTTLVDNIKAEGFDINVNTLKRR